MRFFKKIVPEFYKENSILTVTKIVEWKKQQDIYNFKTLPKTVVLTSKNNFIKGFKKFSTKKIKGLSGKNYILKKDVLLSSNFGNGAPAIISQMEELRALGVENYVFIGFSGMLNSELKEGNAYIVSRGFSATGTSYFYNEEEEINYENAFYYNIKSKLNIQEKIVVSTDAPFRETPFFIKNYIEKGCDLIDMETAAILAFSKFYNLNSACVLIASDRIESSNWSAPKNMRKLANKMDDIIEKLVKI